MDRPGARALHAAVWGGSQAGAGARLVAEVVRHGGAPAHYGRAPSGGLGARVELLLRSDVAVLNATSAPLELRFDR